MYIVKGSVCEKIKWTDLELKLALIATKFGSGGIMQPREFIRVLPRPAYMYASIYRSILFWASVHETLSVGYAAVISQWTLDIFRKFLKPLHSKF